MFHIVDEIIQSEITSIVNWIAFYDTMMGSKAKSQ